VAGVFARAPISVPPFRPERGRATVLEIKLCASSTQPSKGF
jgi:hypothetical protein